MSKIFTCREAYGAQPGDHEVVDSDNRVVLRVGVTSTAANTHPEPR